MADARGPYRTRLGNGKGLFGLTEKGGDLSSTNDIQIEALAKHATGNVLHLLDLFLGHLGSSKDDRKLGALIRAGVCVCVCVCCPLTRYQSQGKFTPPNACDIIPPLDSAHQPLPGEMLADGCPLGNVYETATSHGCLLESCPAHHSVTLRFHFGHLPFLPFQISKESDMRSQCNYAQKTPILTQTKSGEAFETIRVTIGLVQRLQNFGQGAQLGNKYRFCMEMTDRPLRATNFDTILSCPVLWEWKSIDVSRELPMKIAAP